MGRVWCNDIIQSKGLTILSTARLRMVLLSTVPAAPTMAWATSTAATGDCCGKSSRVISNAIETKHVAPTTLGRQVWFKKTTDIAGIGSSTKWITNVGLYAYGSTIYFITKCSSRNYSTSGPDKINVSSFAIIFYDPSTAT